MKETTLIVTMGGQAQVVTFALDWLLAQDARIREVVVLHLSPDDQRTNRALSQVAAEFSGDCYQGQPCRLRLVPIRRGDRPSPFGDRLVDIRDEADADATWHTVYYLLRSLKAQGRPLHLCIAGGRRIMGLLTLSAAMLLCGHHDRVWHMYTPIPFLERARDGAIMHARPEDGVHLIQVPMVPWGAYLPALRDLPALRRAQGGDLIQQAYHPGPGYRPSMEQAAQPPSQVIATQTAWLDETERARCQAVVAQLTPRQMDVLRAFASGQTPQAVAEELNISLKTVDSHKTAILGECRVAWALPDDARLDYHFLRDKFGPLVDEVHQL